MNIVRQGLRGAVPFGQGSMKGPGAATLPPLEPPSAEKVELYRRSAFALQTVESASRTDAKHYGIAAAVLFSLGASIALSARDAKLRMAGAVMAGAGAGGGAVAVRSHLRSGEAATLKNRYVRALVAGGYSSDVPITEGA